MNPEVTSDGPEQLVEHFFRHESAKLIAVLARAFGVRHLDLIEDKTQEALITAMETWGRHGIPSNPSGWIYRVARNRVLDVLRREKIHQRAMAWTQGNEQYIVSLADQWIADDQVPDSLLRMMFVCCHPVLDRRSQIALTLKILCGFSLSEIARGLLISNEAAKKRVQRAKKALAEEQIKPELPPADELQQRLSAVQEVLYLMFNEGYSATQGHEPLRDDICEEAARLCHLLCGHESFGTPETKALLALMLAHSARLGARVDSEGATILLADQDRSLWDRGLVRAADDWLERSKTDHPSRFHYEAAIALTHCFAPTLEQTRWDRIVFFYDRLLQLHPSPLYRLNRAIARAESGDVDQALEELESLRGRQDMSSYFLLSCALGRLHELRDDSRKAVDAYTAALSGALAEHERALLERRISQLRGAQTDGRSFDATEELK